ncbi:MAG: DNA helicase PcrA [Actinobacteria bacterium]|nr:DNA helicase PcrA [Actinomycetota bacterium]
MAGKPPDSDYLDSLNPPQREAVEHTGGPLLIIAGAGSGKTRVLTYRIAHLIHRHDVSPGNIMALTFTNKAAQEMKGRVEGLIGTTGSGMMLATFHSACARILRREIAPLGYSSRFTIYDQVDSVRLIKQCMEEMGFDPRRYNPRALKASISMAKNEMVDEESYPESATLPFEKVTATVYKRYQERLKESDALDFDDLLLMMVYLLELFPDVLERYRERYRHILVDEYQDTNVVQYRLVKLLAEEHRQLCVVGDDDQGIYSWRGADIRNILEFETDYPDARVIKLEQNYRSTPQILEAAGVVVSKNTGRKEKKLWTANPSGEKIRCYEAKDEHAEAGFVCGRIERLADGEDERRYDAAVFYRTHAQSRVLEEALIRRGIPYRVFGGTRFYERLEIKDIVAYLRLLANPRDEVSLRRVINVPPRGIGKVTVGHIEEHGRRKRIGFADALQEADEIGELTGKTRESVAGFLDIIEYLTGFSKEHDVSELLQEVWHETGYMADLESQHTMEAESRVENLKELLGVAGEFRKEYGAVDLDDFLERVSLVSDTDDLDTTSGYVSLMTFHNAKGLEFPVVFMVGMEEGIFPHVRSMDSADEMEEERRLCYVGMTRAIRALYVVHARSRSLWGGLGENPISRFIAEVPREFLEQVDRRDDEEEEGEGEKAGPEEFEIEVGDTVVHAKWGEGTVLELVELEDDCEVTVQFPGAGRKRLLLGFAPLAKE